jgi:RNA polymerase sigma-70 factor (ECF subfamily)
MQTSSSDEMLVIGISKHNSEAFSQLYDRHAAAVYQLILRIVREPAVADELLQDTFYSIWQKANQYEQRGSVAAWLHRVARNRCLDELRKRKSRPQSANLSETENRTILNTKPDRKPQIEEMVAGKWMHQQLHVALEELPREQRDCIHLAYFKGMSQRQIADHLSIPLGTVKTRIRLAVEKLENLLDEPFAASSSIVDEYAE